jgi:uncharacterized tellurite resistance protein B-like protein
MLGKFKKIFNSSSRGKSGLSKEDRELRLKTATCVILLEAATADENFSEQEQRKILDILKVRYNMTDDEVEELIEKSERERADSTDLWYFTNLINENMDNEEKYSLLELVWEVIYSDGTLDKFENYIARKLQNMLNLDHSTFIELKMKVKNEITASQP